MYLDYGRKLVLPEDTCVIIQTPLKKDMDALHRNGNLDQRANMNDEI